MNAFEMNNLEYIGSGSYGKIYKSGDQAFKLYYNSLDKDYHKCTFYTNKLKLYKLKSRTNDLDNCYHINDFVYSDDKIIGTNYDFVNGKTLDKILNNFNRKERIEISKKLVQASKMLTDKKIYPLDYKLNNIMYDINGNIVLIDLDDPLTKLSLIKNPILLEHCLQKLSLTIITFIEKKKNLYHNLEKYIPSIELKNQSFITYQKIENYLKELNDIKSSILINDNDINLTNMLYIKNLVDLTNAKIIIEKRDSIRLSFIYEIFKQLDLNIYDFKEFGNNDEYIKEESLENTLFFKKEANLYNNLNHDVKILTKK